MGFPIYVDGVVLRSWKLGILLNQAWEYANTRKGYWAAADMYQVDSRVHPGEYYR